VDGWEDLFLNEDKLIIEAAALYQTIFILTNSSGGALFLLSWRLLFFNLLYVIIGYCI